VLIKAASNRGSAVELALLDRCGRLRPAARAPFATVGFNESENLAGLILDPLNVFQDFLHLGPAHVESACFGGS
jgi:hypothetical protein